MSRQVVTVNPVTEEILKEYNFFSDQELEAALSNGIEAFDHWKRVQLEARLECVRTFAEGLQAARITFSELITLEMGKSSSEALSEIDKCVKTCHYLRENFPKWKADLEYTSSSGYAVTREPMGLLLGIMPWNFPAWQVVRFAIPALLNGNTILLKHAPNTFGSAEFIADLFRQAFPDSVYQDIRVDVEAIPKLIADRRIQGVSLTGSRQAGKSVGRLAGEHLKKCVLELGGSDAYVILDDADLDLAARVCATGRLVNSGQSCVSAKRFIVTKKNSAEFSKKMIAEMTLAKKLAPLARADLRTLLHKQVQNSIRLGAKKELGGELPEGLGFYYPATVLTGVCPGQPAFDEELFGPVSAIIEAKDEEEAFQLANQSIYGLGGAIFSRDIKRAKELARTRMEAGMICVNDFIRSDASAPFGGIKDSGLGRELGREGSFEFSTIRSVYST